MFSVGANLGATFSKIKYGYDDDSLSLPFNATEGSGCGFNGRGLASFVVGYGYLFPSCLYLGAEALVDANFSKNHKLETTQSLSIHTKEGGFSCGVLANFGGAISQNTLLYVGVGAKSNKFEYSVQGHVLGIIGGKFIQSKRSFRPLYEVGLGGYFASSKNITWRTAYQYVPGKTLKAKRFPVGNILFHPTGNSFSTVKTQDHTLRIGVAYHF